MIEIFQTYYLGFWGIALTVIFAWGFWRYWRALPPKIFATSTANPPPRAFNSRFLILSFCFCFSLGAFHFYLGFPGYLWDPDIFSALMLRKINWHPIFTAFVLENLYYFFGPHSYFLFLMNCITLYLGLWFLMAAFYVRFHSKWSCLVLGILLIGNITLGNFVSMSYILMANFIFCAYAVILFLIFADNILKKLLKIFLWLLVFVLLFFAILWRHNAIFSVYPVFLIICYLCLENRALNLKAFFKHYAILMVISAILCVAVAMLIPKILVVSWEANPAQPLLVSQMVGTCAPANDASCFDHPEFYLNENKSFETIKKTYEYDPFFVFWCYRKGLFVHCPAGKELTKLWLKAILKHPDNFLKHVSRFVIALWFQNPRDDDDVDHSLTQSVIKRPQSIQQDISNYTAETLEDGKFALKRFAPNEHKIYFSPMEEYIYTILYNYLPVFSHYVFVALAFFILIIGVFYLKKDLNGESRALLVFTISAAFAAFASAVIIGVMAMVTWSRYMSTVPILSAIAWVALVAFFIQKSTVNKEKFSKK